MSFEPVETLGLTIAINEKREAYLELAKAYEHYQDELNERNNLSSMSFATLKMQEIQEEKTETYKELKGLEAELAYRKAANELKEYGQAHGIHDYRDGDKTYRSLVVKKLKAEKEWKSLTINEWRFNRYYLPVINHKLAQVGGY